MRRSRQVARRAKRGALRRKVAEAACRASAVACGSERSAFAHEFRKVAVDDAVALLDGIVAREDVLGVVVANLLKRGVFAVFGLAVVHHRHARLHVGVASIALAEYEVAFKRSATPYACRSVTEVPGYPLP